MSIAFKAALVPAITLLAASSNLQAAAPYQIHLQKAAGESVTIPGPFQAVLVCCTLRAKPNTEKTKKLSNGMYSVSFGDADLLPDKQAVAEILLTEKVWADPSAWPLLFGFEEDPASANQLMPVKLVRVDIRYHWQDAQGVRKRTLDKMLIPLHPGQQNPVFQIQAIPGTAVGGPPVRFRVESMGGKPSK